MTLDDEVMMLKSGGYFYLSFKAQKYITGDFIAVKNMLNNQVRYSFVLML
jgi:hypothetical protein